MLESFTVSAKTDGDTKCKITVEPDRHHADLIVTVAGRIVAMGDEERLNVKSFGYTEWNNIGLWGQKAAELAKHFSHNMEI